MNTAPIAAKHGTATETTQHATGDNMSNTIDRQRERMAVISTERRANVLAFIKASAVEVLARRRFREEPTHDNLTTWTNAKNELDDRITKL